MPLWKMLSEYLEYVKVKQKLFPFCFVFNHENALGKRYCLGVLLGWECWIGTAVDSLYLLVPILVPIQVASPLTIDTV